MSDRTKKIIFAVVFIFLSIAIGVALYTFFFKPLIAPTPTSPTTQGPSGQLPQAGPGGPQGTQQSPGGPGGLQTSPTIPVGLVRTTINTPADVTLLRDGVTQAVSPATNGEGVRFYNPDDGRFYRINPDGSATALSDRQFFNVQQVSWANKDNQAILDFPDGGNIFYDFNQNRQATLPSHWEGFDFSPDDKQIVAKSIGLDESNRFLIVSQPNGNEAQAIEQLGSNGDKIVSSWSPNNQSVAFSETGRPQPDGAEEVYLIGKNQENFKSLIVPGRGFMPNWSPTGQQILYSVYHERDDLKPSLWVADGSGDNIGNNRRALNLLTWANKCVWSDETQLICAVPQSLDEGAGLDPSQSASEPDDIYRVDLKSGISVKISTPDQIRPVSQPVLSSDKKKLFFTDSVTGRLYSYNLP